MAVNLLHRPYGITDQLAVMYMANRFGKGFCIGGTYHQFGAFRPPFDLVPAECPSINMLCERPAQNLGQVSDRNDDLDRVAMDKHEPGIRVNRLDLAERK